jgi:hypothetical protein
MKTLTSASRSKYDGVLIYGDFNHPSIKWTSESTLLIDNLGMCTASGKFFENILVKLKLFQHINEPTFCLNNEKQSILDLTFTDCKDRINYIIHEDPLKLIKQVHHILRFQYTILRYWSKQGQLKSLNYSKGDYAKLNGYFNLLQDSWVTIFKNLDIDQCLNTFMNIYHIGVENIFLLLIMVERIRFHGNLRD